MTRDADKDGKVSKEEAGDQLARMFNRMDADKDGFLTKTEIETMAKQFQNGGGRRGGGEGGCRGPSTRENRPDFDE